MSEQRAAELEAEVARLRDDVGSLRLALDGERYTHRKDNEYLLAARDKAHAALEDIRMERSHGATANSEYIDRRIAEGLEGRA